MRRFLLVSATILCCLAGAVVGLSSLDAQAWIYGPLERSARYGGVGGGMRGLIEGAYAMFAGMVVGGRLAWLAGGLLNRLTGGQAIPGDRPEKIDAGIVGVLLVWVYLIWASW